MANSSKDDNAKGAGKTLETDNTTKLDVKNDVQEPVQEAQLIKPKCTIDAMAQTVTIPVTRVRNLAGNMTVLTTTEGEMLVPPQGFANEKQPNELAADLDQPEGEGVAVVTLQYARSMGLI